MAVGQAQWSFVRVRYSIEVLDARKLYESELGELLAGETPLVAVSCDAAFGEDRLERSPEEVDQLVRFLPQRLREEAVELLHGNPPQRPERAWEKLANKVLDAATGDLVTGDPDKVLGGVAASGHVGSWAHRISKALAEATISYCVVSPSRVVFAEHDLKTHKFQELGALPRQAVLRARRAGKFLQRGRVVLDFADMSALAVRTGILSAGGARRLVAVLDGGIARGD